MAYFSPTERGMRPVKLVEAHVANLEVRTVSKYIGR